MATKTPQAGSRRRRNNDQHLEDVGNVGRATGLHMPEASRGDDGYDRMSDYFPTTGKANRGQRKSSMTTVSSEDMDIEESSALEVTDALLQRSAKSTHKPPPPSKSPMKANMRGTPRRPSSIGPPSSAKTQATAPRSGSQTPGTIPKLDLHPGVSPRRPYQRKANDSARRSGTFSISPSPEKGRRASEPLRDLDTDVDDTTGNISAFDDAPPMLPDNFEDDTLKGMEPNALDDSLVDSQPSAQKRKKSPQPTTRRTRQSDQSNISQQDETAEEEPMINQQEEEEEEPEPEPEPEPEVLVNEDDEPQAEPGDQDESMQELSQPAEEPKKKRGRPPKSKSTEEPNSKRQRKNPAKKAEAEVNANKPKPKRGRPALASKDANRKIREGSSEQPTVKSNVRERHETPFEEDETQYTSRSGRLVYKPLAHWKNERVNLRPEETKSGDFVYQITDLVRMDDVTPVKRAHNRSEETVIRRRKKKTVTTIFEESDPEDHAESWEDAEGVIAGAVRTWDAEQEMSLEERRHQELAFSGSRIEARENAEGSFRFAKTVSMPHFGSGVVELPPGGIKKTKNSRRMQMAFFVHFGKVTVEVADTRFVITKGGTFQVPRGNNYSIANETEHEAKVWFAQACEYSSSAENAAPNSGPLPVR